MKMCSHVQSIRILDTQTQAPSHIIIMYDRIKYHGLSLISVWVSDYIPETFMACNYSFLSYIKRCLVYAITA